MKTFLVTFTILLIPFLGTGQKDLKKIILNKKKTLPNNWVDKIQTAGEWKHQKTVTVRNKRVKDYFIYKNGEEWDFQDNSLEISTFSIKNNQTEDSDYSIQYFENHKIILLKRSYSNNNKTYVVNEPYQVVNLTKEYLILEKINDTYCFDFSKGRKLSKKECKEKERKEPERLFGGREINIGRKPPKYRLVFKLTQN